MTAPTAPRRCVYCGERYHGRKSVACPRHRTLEALDWRYDPALRLTLVDDLRQAVRRR